MTRGVSKYSKPEISKYSKPNGKFAFLKSLNILLRSRGVSEDVLKNVVNLSAPKILKGLMGHLSNNEIEELLGSEKDEASQEVIKTMTNEEVVEALKQNMGTKWKKLKKILHQRAKKRKTHNPRPSLGFLKDSSKWDEHERRLQEDAKNHKDEEIESALQQIAQKEGELEELEGKVSKLDADATAELIGQFLDSLKEVLFENLAVPERLPVLVMYMRDDLKGIYYDKESGKWIATKWGRDELDKWRDKTVAEPLNERIRAAMKIAFTEDAAAEVGGMGVIAANARLKLADLGFI